MALPPQSQSAKKVTKPLSRKAIRERLLDIDIAQTSALRDLEMDIQGVEGKDAKTVLQAARKALG